jgi:hypothetical protein
MDIKATYLNTKLDVDIYIIYLKILESEKKTKWKVFYELKQAGRMWNSTLKETLLKLKFHEI